VVRGCRQLIMDGKDALAGRSDAGADRRHEW